MRSTSKLRLFGAVSTSVVLVFVLIPQHVSALTSGGLLAQVNAQRASAGLSSLRGDSRLNSSAYAKAKHMCDKDYWAHTSPDGLTGWTFIGQSGYPYISAAENLAEGYSSDSAAVSAWMASSGHRANILNGGFQDFGAGYMSCNFMGRQSTVIVAHFGAQSVKKAPVAPAPTPKPAAKPRPVATPVTQPAPMPKTNNNADTGGQQTPKVATKPKSTKTEVKSKSAKQPVKNKKRGIVTLLLSRLHSSRELLFEKS